MPHVATTKLRSVSPYSQSRKHHEPKLDKESADDYELRTWRLKAHVNDKGHIFIPPMAFKFCLAEAAQFLGNRIPGKGVQTWGKNFLAGILVLEGIELPEKPDTVLSYTGYMHSNGQRNTGKRVPRTFPVVPKWEGQVTWHIFDDTITEEVFRYHLDQSGKFIGIGRFRPRNGGINGRFEIVKMKWE